ncbi:hypothetical protein [Micromonospora cremea]|uniref:Uncharacterized protein n=1 Tax=Micromonospora cremea TaxID=709881 RepID=A0A1N5ZX60_9ACTN|nr:hypothetical protein [Micromonospora cremea]SIN26315.1 hypothetical protein SAMN04489832_4583 [Micromonospora cremea]
MATTTTMKVNAPLAWHLQTEWEVEASYAQGYADGHAAAERAIAEEIIRAVGVKPYDRRDVIRWLVRTIDRPREAVQLAGQRYRPDLGVVERQMFGELGRVA